MWITSLFLALLIVVLLQGWYFPKYNFKSLHYRRYFTPDTVNEGESTTLVEKIENSRLLPLPWVQVEALISSDLVLGKEKHENGKKGLRQFQRSLFTIPPFTTITRTHTVQCPKRGYYRIESVSVTTGDILGLTSRKSKDYPTDTALTVFPTLLPIEDIFNIRNSFTGDIVVRRWIVEDPFYIRGVRDYQASDPMNHINWKATARAGSLQVHQYDYTADTRLLLMLNVETEENQWGNTTDEACVERAISIAASIAQYAVDNGIEIGFMTNAKASDDPEEELSLEPQSGAGQLNDLMHMMARMTTRRRCTFKTMLERQTATVSGCDILVIAAFTSEELEEQFDRLRASGNAVEQLTVERTPEKGGVL